MFFDSLAQLVEHLTFNQRVRSSNLLRVTILSAGVVKLADTLDLGSSASACRFKSCHPHHLITLVTVFFYWGLSSVGRASALQAEGQRFEPVSPHHFFYMRAW